MTALKEIALQENARAAARPPARPASSLLIFTLRFCSGWARSVVVVAILLSALAFHYLAQHIAIDTDSAKLIADDIPWRQRDAAFDAAFPQGTDQIVIVVDGVTPERAEAATASLTQQLLTRHDLFKSVRRPDGGSFFDQNGLLFLSKDEVATIMNQLIAGQPLLGSLAADPSLRGLMNALSLYLEGVKQGEAKLDDLATPLMALSDTFKTVLSGSSRPLSWRQLITGTPPDSRSLRRFILVQPVLDYTALSPGAAASDAIRQMAAALSQSPQHDVRVRLTGPVPLEDEEFATLADGAALTSAVTAAAVILLLWLGLRSVKMIVAIVLTLTTGLLLTGAFGLAVIGPLNLISVAFAVLFVGLGVDFGIQYCVRYREEQRRTVTPGEALIAAGSGVGRQLALAAIAIALGFYAFLPTEYRGVSELGLIAGTGMIIAFVLNITLLPALLAILRPATGSSEVGYAALAPLDRFLIRRRPIVLGVFALLAVICLALMPRLSFDSNPINLKSAKVESVATLLDLTKDPNTSPNTIDVLAASPKDATALAARLSALPEVAQAVTLTSFIPEDQPEKLALIEDASMLLGATLAPAEVKPAPADHDDAAAMSVMAKALRDVIAMPGTAPDAKIVRIAGQLADQLDQLAGATPEMRQAAAEALIPGLKVMLRQVQSSLQAQAVTLESLPADLVHDWVAADGRARIQVFPSGDSNDPATLKRFIAAVQTIAPEATGAPISIQESSNTIVRAFEEAAFLAAFCITILLAVVLRRLRDVLLTLAPLFLAGMLTLGTCIIIGQPINFANIIALPLLFGIGVAFNIYFVMAWRNGATAPLQSSLTRAILFSALTTSTAFGSLWFSHHPGTASMGKLLVISLGWTLVTALIFLPALLAKPAKAS